MQNPLSLAARKELGQLALNQSATWDDLISTGTRTGTCSGTSIDEDNGKGTQKGIKQGVQNTDQLIAINPFSSTNIKQGNTINFDIKIDMDSTEKNRKKGKVKTNIEITEPLVFKKKLIQPKFSRRRYLREYNGLHLMPFLLTITGCISVMVIAVAINIGILLPGTQRNYARAENLPSLKQSIATLEPEFHNLIAQQDHLASEAERIWISFPTEPELRQDLNAFLTMLGEDRSLQLINYDILEVPISDDAGAGDTHLSHLNLQMEIKTGFINWMEYRDRLSRNLIGVHVVNETINAPPRQNIVNINTTFHFPYRHHIKE